MFIYTVKANTLKFFAVILAAITVLISVIVITGKTETVTTATIAEANKSINYDKIKTNEDRRSFLKQFGWETEDTEIEAVKIKLPAEFDKIMTEYNELQKSQGLDLLKYKGREVKRYTYKITNYNDYEGTVIANVIVYRNRVIGGDICSAEIDGFIHGFNKPEIKE